MKPAIPSTPMPACIRHLIPIVLLSLLGLTATAAEPTTRSTVAPTTAPSTDDIVKWCETAKGFGCVQTAEFSHWGKKIFAAWYCPFSGRGDCFLHAYYFDYDKMQWTQFIDQLVPTGGDLSAELPFPGDVIMFRDNEGKVLVKESIAKFPQKDGTSAKK
jgi:hypothetical protein